jgi:hypothetical protein
MFGYKKPGSGSGYGFNEDRFGSGSGSVYLDLKRWYYYC